MHSPLHLTLHRSYNAKDISNLMLPNLGALLPSPKFGWRSLKFVKCLCSYNRILIVVNGYRWILINSTDKVTYYQIRYLKLVSWSCDKEQSL